MQKIVKFLADKRMIVFSLLSVSVFIAVSQYNLSLWWILIIGIASGVIFGKVFCRWVCPMGLIMEIMMNMSSDGKVRQMY